MQVRSLEEGLEQLEKRCKGLIKGSRNYKDTVQGLCSSQMNYAECLEDFCGGTDEDSLTLGTGGSAVHAPVLPALLHCGTFRSMALLLLLLPITPPVDCVVRHSSRPC